jgi:hypothetical protein
MFARLLSLTTYVIASVAAVGAGACLGMPL